MRISEDDKNSQKDNALLREIKQIEEGVNTREELVATYILQKSWDWI